MASFKNTQGITMITLRRKIKNFCPLGNDWYTNELTIEFEPTDIIPDYIEVDKKLNELEGKSLVIEDVVDKVGKIFEDYGVRIVVVTSSVEDAVHLPVEVQKIISK